MTTDTKIVDSIDSIYKLDLQNNRRLSSFIDEDKYQLLFLRTLRPITDNLDFQTLCFLFKDDLVFVYKQDIHDFEKLQFKNSFQKEITQLLRHNSNIVKTFSSEIESMEESLYDRDFSKHFIDVWFDLRNDLSKIDRYYTRLIEVLQDFQIHMQPKKKVKSGDLKQIVSLLQFTLSKIKDELSRLDILHHYYLSIKGDRLNRSIFFLTIVSGIFLPLNLVVGFFGMNTENLFFKDNPLGTQYVVYILVGLISLMLFFAPVFKILDRYLLSRILGKVSIYKKLNQHVEKISESFKVE
jgi:magnesium transporter